MEGSDRYYHWLRYEANNEVDQLTWYNLIAMYILNDDKTLMLMTPKEAGWNDE